VGDEEIGEAVCAPKRAEEVDDLGADGDVERADGLVEDEKLRFEGEGPGDVDALTLAAGELMREAREGGGVEADLVQQSFEAGGQALGRALAMDGEGLGEDLPDAHAGVEGGEGVLEDDLHAAAHGAELAGAEGEEVGSVVEDLASGGFNEAEEHAGDGGFAGAGLADEAKDFPAMNGEGDVFNDTAGAIIPCEFQGFHQRCLHEGTGCGRSGFGVAGSRHGAMVASGSGGTGMPESIEGRVAIVTGASSGVGRATAVSLAERGASVVVTARRESRLREVVREIEDAGGRAVLLAGDAAEETTARDAVAMAVAEFGRVDVLVNNAGAGLYRGLIETSAAEFDELMQTNVRSGFLFAREAARVMMERGRGDIVFVSSVAGLQGAAGESVYCATKFAQVGMAQALDAELRPKGIKVGVVCPGGVKTEFAVGRGRTEEWVRESHMMEAREVAEAIVFACMQPANVRIPQMTVRHMGGAAAR